MPDREPVRGYGSKLIERSLGFALRARTELLFGRDGVSCLIEIPLRAEEAVDGIEGS